MNTSTKYILAGVAVLVAIAGTAAASSYFTRQSMVAAEATAPVQPVAVKKAQQPHRQQVAATKPGCDDHNVVGTVGGAVAGGLVGSAFGKGSGRGLATAGGAVAGGALGNAYIPTRGATCE